MADNIAFPEHNKLEDLIDRCEELLEIKDTTKLDVEAKKQTNIFFTVQRLLAVETKALEFFVKLEAEVEIQRRRYYEGRLPQQVYAKEALKYPSTSKTETDICLKSDGVFTEAKGLANAARQRVKFLEDVLWRVKERGSEIQTIMAWKKYIEAGI